MDEAPGSPLKKPSLPAVDVDVVPWVGSKEVLRLGLRLPKGCGSSDRLLKTVGRPGVGSWLP